MANPFAQAPLDEPEKAPKQTNPFALAPIQEAEQTTTAADNLQNQTENSMSLDALEAQSTPQKSANFEREWAQADVSRVDLPMPKTYTEAIGGAMKRHGHSFRPHPQSSDDLVQLSDRLAYTQMQRSGLIDKNGAIAGVNSQMVTDLRGSYLNNLTTLYADITPEEHLKVTQRSITRIADSMQQNALSRINTLTQKLKDDFDLEPSDIENPDALRHESARALAKDFVVAREDFNKTRELSSRSDDPRVHAWFYGAAFRAADQMAMLAPKDTEQHDRAQIFKGLMTHPFKQQEIGGWPAITRGDGPLAEQYSELLERNLNLTDVQTGKAKAFALQKTMELAIRGTLIEERMQMFNIPQEFSEQLTPTNMLAFTHPQLVGRMGDVLGNSLGKNYIAQNADGPLKIDTFNQKVEQWKSEHGEAIADRLIDGGVNPLMQLRQELDFSVRDGADEFKNTIDKALEGIGAYAMTYSDKVGDAIGTAQKVYGDLIAQAADEDVDPEEKSARIDKLVAGSTELALGAMAGAASERMNDALAEGEKDAKLAMPGDPMVESNNPWLQDMGALTQQVTDGDRVRMGLTKEASERIFNPGNNSFRQGAMWLADEVAATTVDKFAPLGFHGSTIRQAFKELRSSEFGDRLDQTILKGATEKEFQESAETVRRLRADAGGGLAGLASTWKETLGLGAMQFGRDMRGTVQLLMEEPDDLAVLTVTGAGAGYIGSQAMKGLKNQTIGRIARMQTMHRTRLVLQKALRNSPDAVDQIRRTTTLLQTKTKNVLANGKLDKKSQVGLNQRHAALETASDALEYASDARKLVMEATPDLKDQRLLKWYDGQLKESARTASEITRHIDPRELGELLDELNLDGVTRSWIKNAGNFSTLREAAADKLGFHGGNKKVPFVSGIGRNLLDSMEDDPTLSLADLPISPEVALAHNTNFLMKMFPSKRREIAKARYQQEAMRWMGKYQDDTIARRAVGAENRSNLEQFTIYGRTVEANRLRRIAAMKGAAEGAGDVERVARLADLRAESLGRVSQFRAVRQELIDSGTPMDKTRLRDNPMFDEYQPEQLIQFLSVRHGRQRVYDTLRGEFESADSFWKRTAQMGSRFDIADEALENQAGNMKRKMVAEFFEQPGLNDNIRIDLMEGHISPAKLRRNINERKAIGKAFLKDELDDLADRIDNPADVAFLGELLDSYDNELTKLQNGQVSDILQGAFTTRKNLASEWAEIGKRAATERANRFRIVNGISGAAEWGIRADIHARINDGKTRTAVADAKAYGLQQRLLTRAWTKKVDNVQRQLSKLSKDEQQLFNAAATIARDEGITAPLAMLRKRKEFKNYFDEIAPETDDIAVQRLWDDGENFRKSFLKDLADVGLIDRKQFDKLVGPYAPRLFSSTQMPKLYGTDGVDLSLVDSKISGVSLGELQSQRHLSKVKAQIYPKGGRPITRKFDNVGQAEDWIAENYGSRTNVELMEEGGLTGTTGSGSQFAILKPLGKEARELGADFIGAGDGMFIQMRNLIEDMNQIRYFNAFDRPGIAFDTEGFRRFAIDNPEKVRKQYTRLPESKKLGSLSGKHVHRSVLNQMDHYSDVKKIMGEIQDAVEGEAFVAAGDVTSLIDTAPGLVTKFNAFQKAGIAYNMIARNPATMVGNFLSDAMYFTRMAAGSRINLTAKGWKMGAESFDIIRGIRSGKTSLDDLSPEIKRGIELGVVDESIFEVAGLQSERKVLDIEATYGQKKSPGETFLSPLKDDNVRKAMERHDVVEGLLKAGGLSARKETRLLRERFALETVTKQNMGTFTKLLAKASNISDGLVGKNRGRSGDIEGFSARFYGDLGNTNRLRAYMWMVREEGMSPEAAAGRVNRFMQTYSQIGTSAVGRQVQKFGKSGLGSPIVSFPFELARTTKNIAMHNPAGMAAMMGTSLARNMMAIGASGMDPYESLEFLEGQSGGVLNLIGSQFIPLPNQQNLVVSNPALNIFGQVFNSYGVVNGLASAWDDSGDDTALAKIMRQGTGIATNIAFTNPLLNAGLGMMSKRDSLSGEINRSGYQLLGDTAKKFIQPMMHPYTPRFGAFSEKLVKNRDAFKHAYSGREHALFNRMFEIAGFKVKGDAAAFLDALPATLGDPIKDAALRGTKAVAWMSLWEDVPDERVFGKSEGLGIEDYFAMVVATSSYLDPQNGHDMGGANEQALTQMRRGVNLMSSDDAAESQRGRSMVTEAEAEIIRLRTTREDASGLGFTVGREATAREVRNITVRMLEMGEGYDEALESFSVLRRTGIVARMAITRDVPETMMDNLFKQFLLTRSGGLRGPANSDEIGQSLNLIEKTLELRADLNETNRERLTLMHTTLTGWEAVADAREQVENLIQDKYIRANQVLKEAKGQ